MNKAMKRWLAALLGLAFAVSFARAGELEIVRELASYFEPPVLTRS